MVLDKRLYYGFNGYKVPSTPQAPRSARRRRIFEKKSEEDQLYAFDLLASVAGKLLLESETSPASSNTSTYNDQNLFAKNTVKKELVEGESPKVEPRDKGINNQRDFVSQLAWKAHNQKCSSKGFPHSQNDTYLGSTSVALSSDCSKRFDAEKVVIWPRKNETESFSSKLQLRTAGHMESNGSQLETDTKLEMHDEPLETEKMEIQRRVEICSIEDPDICDGKPVALVSSGSSVKVPLLCSDQIGCSLQPRKGDVKVVSRDDDENSSGCTHPRTTSKLSRLPMRIGDRRIRRLLASRCWKAAPKIKEHGSCNTDGDIKPLNHNRNSCYKRQRSQRIYPFKKRKLFYQSSASNSDGGISSVGNSESLEKAPNFNSSGSDQKMSEANGQSSSVAVQHPSFQHSDSQVKLRIKSFRVPEILIEIPETSTIGSLKRTVAEAVTAILGGGLHVGVLLHGKKVRDDNKTLLQNGISSNNQMDDLGFILEPNQSQAPQSLCPITSPLLLPSDVPETLSRYPSSPTVNRGTSSNFPKPHVADVSNFVESDHDSAPSPIDMSIDKKTRNSKALVTVPAISVEALAVVPHRKFKRSEIAQRRIRRPFSVSEVEALVQAVEKLGTGRWRDVKLRAFEDAKHRTYVDLKDKWKTLVHTARISPQQRRGEPVPQELLDRVIAAHGYWSQRQAKNQFKQQQETSFLL